MFAPSATQIHPLSTSCFACSPFNSFCVAQGKATSHETDHGFSPLKNLAFGYAFTYSLILPLFTFFRSITYANLSESIPSVSKIYPDESDRVTTFAPS